MKLPDSRFNPALVRNVGFIIGDKQEGNFELEIDWIKAKNLKSEL